MSIRRPALLAVIEPQILDMAFSEFETGKTELYFGTDVGLGKALEPRPENVYFKVNGKIAITAQARVTALTTENQPTKRLPGFENKSQKYYYGFSNLVRLSPEIPLSKLNRFESNLPVRNDVTGVFRINDIVDAEQSALEELERRTDIPETRKRVLRDARIGQGDFRAAVERVEAGCRVTGLKLHEELPSGVLHASHIKPWSKSNDTERLDGNNGLLFSPHVHYLFDHGYLTFEADGRLRLSSRLRPEIINAWNLGRTNYRAHFSPEQDLYLAYHRETIFSDRRC